MRRTSANVPTDRPSPAQAVAFESTVPNRRAAEGPSAGLDREAPLRAVYPTTCSDAIADRRSWYSPMLRTWPPASSGEVVAADNLQTIWNAARCPARSFAQPLDRCRRLVRSAQRGLHGGVRLVNPNKIVD